jgi:Transposase IS200 like
VVTHSSQAPGGFSDRVLEGEELELPLPGSCPAGNATLTGEHFWARGYAVSTVGFELEQVRRYIREQGDPAGSGGQF